MKVGTIFYSVMQKDNNPFEKPRIVKFVVDKILNENATHPIVATKTDKWGRHYCFKESQIYLTYQDAIPEKMQKIEKIKQWEKDRAEMNKRIAEEQQKKDELEKNEKAIKCLEDVRMLLLPRGNTKIDMYNKNYINEVIDQKIKKLKGEQ